jgi:hypothetical protein
MYENEQFDVNTRVDFNCWCLTHPGNGEQRLAGYFPGCLSSRDRILRIPDISAVMTNAVTAGEGMRDEL